MQPIRERFAEYPITNIDYVRVRVVLEHPAARDSLTMCHQWDRRMFDFDVPKKPSLEAEYDRIRLMMWDEARKKRADIVETVARQIAHSILNELDRIREE
jgi:hypothetical protein